MLAAPHKRDNDSMTTREAADAPYATGQPIVAACPRPPPAFAALDLGTNNCRMLVATPASTGFRVVEGFSRTVRLGEGLHASGALCPAAMDRALAALTACAERLDRRPIRAMRAVATEACRRASNGAAFLADVKHRTGLTVSIISAREEVELALESCAPLLADTGRRALLLDIGGGSTELAWVRLDPSTTPQLIGYISLPIGVVTLAEQFGPASTTHAGFDAMVDHVAARLTHFEQTHCIQHELRHGGVTLLGTSGTVTTLAGVALGLEHYRRQLVDGAILTGEDAEAALDLLRTLGPDGLSAHPCVGPDRVEFVLPGCAIFTAILRTWPAPRVIVADRGLREGMLLRMIRATRPHRPFAA
ncbi:MAG TPA: Ppx/GppA phosphatase family protein [Acetobacteraceae bacterium]|nr:Ppx/GppA phosphatase family protein [Acetobacteraceae bacterium]